MTALIPRPVYEVVDEVDRSNAVTIPTPDYNIDACDDDRIDGFLESVHPLFEDLTDEQDSQLDDCDDEGCLAYEEKGAIKHLFSIMGLWRKLKVDDAVVEQGFDSAFAAIALAIRGRKSATTLDDEAAVVRWACNKAIWAMEKAARTMYNSRHRNSGVLIEDDGPAPEWGITPLDWAQFWKQDAPIADWVAEPLVARGRATAIYSRAKVGKSLLGLDIAAAKATGRSALGQPPANPVPVVYVDMEMTAADLRERLEDLGYGPDDDLSQLRYYQLAPLPPLDSDEGGELMAEVAVSAGAELVVIDTMARAVEGDENSADTYRSFYRYTGRRLKAANIALLRLDHEGKDGAQGQRGSSAKNDDVDIVFRLIAEGNRIKLRRTHSRVPWVPAEVDIVRQEEPLLRHVVASDGWPAGTSEVARLLDEHDVPLDAQTATACRALRSSGQGRRREIVIAALKFRRTRP
jgi:hypothetical protein